MTQLNARMALRENSEAQYSPAFSVDAAMVESQHRDDGGAQQQPSRLCRRFDGRFNQSCPLHAPPAPGNDDQVVDHHAKGDDQSPQ